LSVAVISALKGLQEKIRKLELERTDAEDNLKRLAKESKHYKDILQKEHYARSATQGIISKQNEGEISSSLLSTFKIISQDEL